MDEKPCSSADYFDKKPQLRNGKVCGGRLRMRAVQKYSKIDSTLVKVLRGTDLSMSKKKKMNSDVFEEFVSGISYSLKKKKRWKILENPRLLLGQRRNEDLTVSVVERVGMSDAIQRKAMNRAISRIRPGSEAVERIETKSGKGADFLSLENSLDASNGIKIKKKKKQHEKPTNPEVTFLLTKNCESEKLLSHWVWSEFKYYYSNATRTRRTNGDFIDDEVFSSIVDETVAEDPMEAETVVENRGFSLADFVVSRKTRQKGEGRKLAATFEFVDEVVLLDEKPRLKPFKESDLCKNSAFLDVTVDQSTCHMTSESFAADLKTFAGSKGLPVFWMNPEKTTCVVDCSQFLNPNQKNCVVGFSLIGTGNCFLRIVINADFPLENPLPALPRFHRLKLQKKSRFELFLRRLFEGIRTAFYKLSAVSANLLQIRQEAFVFSTFTTVLEPKTDNQLWTDYAKLARTLSTDSFEFLTSETCTVCEAVQDLFDLDCAHKICEKCAKKSFKNQVFNRLAEIACPTCGSTQNLLRISFFVPLPLIRVFLKSRFEKQAKTKVKECPKCRGLFEKVADFSGVKCRQCCIAFCQECFEPPHFPLKCDQMKLWIGRFDQRYRLAQRENVAFGRCNCGNLLVMPPKSRFQPTLNCDSCKSSYWKGNDDRWTSYGYRGQRSLEMVDSKSIPTLVRREFSAPCIEIRAELEDASRTAQIRKLAVSLLGHEKTRRLMALRLEIFRLIEYGTAWLYFGQKQASADQWKKVEKALRTMATRLNVVVSQIFNRQIGQIDAGFEILQRNFADAVLLF